MSSTSDLRIGAAASTLGVSGQREEEYAFVAARRDGTIERGTLQAWSRDEAARRLSARGLFPMNILRSEGQAKKPAQLSIASEDLALGLRLLSSLFRAGLPMDRALLTFTTLAPKAWRLTVLESIRSDVREGKSFATALAAAPVSIPALVIGIVRAGEVAGRLGDSVQRAADVTEETARTRAAVRNALVYPAILGLAGLLSTALLVGVVLPRFVVILTDLGEAIPVSTALLLAMAQIVADIWLPMTMIFALGLLFFRNWLARSDVALRAFHRCLLLTPIVGSLRRQAASSRVTISLSAMLSGGVPISRALSEAALAAGDSEIAWRLNEVRRRVVAGERLSDALSQETALTAGSVHLVRAGEAVGDLPSMLRHAAALDGQQMENRLRNLVRLIEPTLILCFGGIVALVAASLLEAVYRVRPQ